MHPLPRTRRRRTSGLVAIALAVPLAAIAAPTAASASVATAHGSSAHSEHSRSHQAWTQYQHDAAKTGWNSDERVLTRRNVATLTQRWAAAGLAGSPIVVGERVFVVLSGKLTAFSRNTGRQLWQTVLAGDVAIPPGGLAYGDGRVVVTTSGGVEAVQASSGAVAWHNASIGGSVGATVDGDRVYLGSSDHHVYRLSLETGKIRWARLATDEVASTVAVSGNTVYVGAGDDLLALRSDTGTVRWHTPIGRVFGGGPAVRGGTVYIASDPLGEGGGAALFAVRASSGKVSWQASIGGDVHAAPSVDDHNVYIGVIDDEALALDARTGHLRWIQQLDGEVRSGIALAGGVAYTTTDASTAYGLDTRTGAVLWTVAVEPTDFATPSQCVVTGGRLYTSFAGLRSYAPLKHHG